MEDFLLARDTGYHILCESTYCFWRIAMNITLKIDEELVKKVRKIAIDKDTTLSQMVRDFLARVARSGEVARKQSSKRFKKMAQKHSRVMNISSRPWTREDLYER